MKQFARSLLLAVGAVVVHGQLALAQTVTGPVTPTPTVIPAPTVAPSEVKLRGVAFTEVVSRLFGPGGLLSSTRPFELKADRVTLTAQQAQSFFTPGAAGMSQDFAALVSRIQQQRGSEVAIRGVVETTGAGGAVTRRPFEAKVEAGEVKIRGLALTQTQFDALVTRLQGTTGARELKVEAVVDGRRVEAKLENGVLRERADGDRRGRGREGTSATLNADRATDRGRDLDHSIRGRDRAELERDKGERGPRVDRAERVERQRAERIERAERPERIERVERPERPERVERAERAERPERVERPDRSGRH